MLWKKYICIYSVIPSFPTVVAAVAGSKWWWVEQPGTCIEEQSALVLFDYILLTMCTFPLLDSFAITKGGLLGLNFTLADWNENWMPSTRKSKKRFISNTTMTYTRCNSKMRTLSLRWNNMECAWNSRFTTVVVQCKKRLLTQQTRRRLHRKRLRRAAK